jgi:hypothetical protein
MRYLFPFLIIGIFYFSACRDNNFDTSPGIALKFSTDSVVFDTVFSGIGSATRRFKVYNPSDKRIRISEIKIAKGDNSKYRLNIDGLPASAATDVEIAGKDSIYIFVEVTINTDQDMLLEQDSVIFLTNGNYQDVKLLAWGQDVHFINAQIVGTATWTNDKPYLIYNSMLVDSNQTLTLEAGTHLYFHRGSRMYVAGTLIIEGTFNEPVILEGDRLEYMYFDVPGQWNGIWLMNGSKHNNFNYAEIKNAVIGIQVDTLADVNIPSLTLSNCKIEHHSYAGIYAQGATITAFNSLIADCGYYALALTIGGSYEFYHCTIANYWSNTFRDSPSLILNNYYEYQGQAIIRPIDKALFANCIVYGNKKTEIVFDKHPDGILNYTFDHCLLKISDDTERDDNNFTATILNQDPLFVNTDDYNYELDTLSPAINNANIDYINSYPAKLSLDIKEFERLINNKADIGAFERENN